MSQERIFTESLNEDPQFYVSLRPNLMKEFIGQEKLKERLEVFMKAAITRKEPLEHILLSGPPGLGKTTLSYIIAQEMGANIKVTSGPVIERPGDLAGLLTNLEEGDVLFIDEIHRLNHMVEEYLYPAMEDFLLDIMIDKGPSARSVRLNLKKFTLVGATTRSGLLSSPLRSRFGMMSRLDFYSVEELKHIVLRSANILNVEISDDGALEIARRSRGTPRITNCLLRRVRDFAQVKADGVITVKVADQALKMLEVDEKGLDEMDRKIIETIALKFAGGPVGINTLSAALSEETDTLEEVYEPYLIQQGYIKRTPSGRKVTRLAYEHFKLQTPVLEQEELL
ncbi:MAG: Holliday junction branch migration DNA helicase RuvB [Chlamydiae bacterium]|nr:Holliday junction branch migration DNA helicase RuvB [Chlamydiota bacterium]MBI3267144.1 Holliday junction branch migration DNA helicase RuvB [Chlamydiota bacterium]